MPAVPELALQMLVVPVELVLAMHVPSGDTAT